MNASAEVRDVSTAEPGAIAIAQLPAQAGNQARSTNAKLGADTANPRIRKFNPGAFQSDEEVMKQFVVRSQELEIVLEALRGNIKSDSCQHVLVVAPRGWGKTMLLARAAAELRTNENMSTGLLPVRFAEESQEIFNLADFWLETLFHLARECSSRNSELSAQLRNTHSELSGRWQDRFIEDHARAAVLSAVDRLGQKIVLMVENMQALGASVDQDFGWKLREALQTESQIMLLATATSRFESLDAADQPFFELFRIISLEPLTTKQCQHLWQSVCSGELSERGIRPLQILTGGSPRLLVIVAAFQQHRSLRYLMEALVTLIDDHTEYFRSHLDVLGKTERRVYLAVIDLWQSSKPGEIAARARMDARKVSTMLGRLVNRGAVLVDGSGRKRFYYAAERLHSIYYKLRRERDEAAVVENLIRFMAVFYKESEQDDIFERLRLEAQEHPTLREALERAIDPTGTTHFGRAKTIGRSQILLEAFAAKLGEFAADDEKMLKTALYWVPAILKAGASPNEVAYALGADTAMREALIPLLVALRKLAGEEVRAPIEVLEVAEDVRKKLLMSA